MKKARKTQGSVVHSKVSRTPSSLTRSRTLAQRIKSAVVGAVGIFALFTVGDALAEKKAAPDGKGARAKAGKVERAPEGATKAMGGKGADVRAPVSSGPDPFSGPEGIMVARADTTAKAPRAPVGAGGSAKASKYAPPTAESLPGVSIDGDVSISDVQNAFRTARRYSRTRDLRASKRGTAVELSQWSIVVKSNGSYTVMAEGREVAGAGAPIGSSRSRTGWKKLRVYEVPRPGYTGNGPNTLLVVADPLGTKLVYTDVRTGQIKSRVPATSDVTKGLVPKIGVEFVDDTIEVTTAHPRTRVGSVVAGTAFLGVSNGGGVAGFGESGNNSVGFFEVGK